MKSYHGCCSPHTAHHICCHGCCSPHHGCPHQSPLYLKCQHLHTIAAGLYPALTPPVPPRHGPLDYNPLEECMLCGAKCLRLTSWVHGYQGRREYICSNVLVSYIYITT